MESEKEKEKGKGDKAEKVELEKEEEKEKEEDVDVEMREKEKTKAPKMKIWKVKWQKQEYQVYYDTETTIDDVKEQLEAQTDVRKEAQKLVGLKILGKYQKQGENQLIDTTLVAHLKCPKKKSFILIGTPDEDMFSDDDLELQGVAFILDDEDWDFQDDPVDFQARHKEHMAKLEKSIVQTKINIMYEPRPKKKLLVLDIDYTLFDMGSKNIRDWNSLKRPFTDHLLSKCYPYYDLVIWSQTSWKWIEIKLTEMGMLMNRSYNISFVLDKKSMFSVVTNYFPSNRKRKEKEKGVPRKHYVKPLELIWRKFPNHYNEHNSIHIDDLARNFAMNPTCGLTIIPYKNAKKIKSTDKELLYITEYLVQIAKKEDFKGLNHNSWRTYLKKHSSMDLSQP